MNIWSVCSGEDLTPNLKPKVEVSSTVAYRAYSTVKFIMIIKLSNSNVVLTLSKCQSSHTNTLT